PQDAGKEWIDSGVAIRNVALPAKIPLLYHAWLTRSLVRAALEFQPQVIHCFKPKAYAGLSAWWLWQQKRLGRIGARLVVDSDDWEGAGGWNDLERYPPPQKRFFAWQERWGLTHNDALTVASRALETIAWSLGLPPARVHYLPNGWWPEEIKASAEEVARLRQKYDLADRPVALLYTRFFEYKVERALAIMQAVLEQEPETRWLVVGKGLFGEEEQLLTMARERGLAGQVIYAGWVPPQEVPAHLALAQVAIYPFDDTLVNRCKCAVKLIDLLAAGVPVVADAVGQNREYIQHGVSGLLVAPGDTAACAASVVRLLHDAELRARMGAAAQERLRTEFAWEKLAVQAERAYGVEPPPGQ
ncbi:MAG: glycosyltransferase family 4 protein, partial [Chloroflexi bacterium]|nr:glycosyltransferase family 4 protein [Chloroflexota bacterium]